MTATPTQALARAHNQSRNGPQFDLGMCLRETRKLYDVPSRYDDAADAWRATRHRIDPDRAPRGALVWWTGGSAGHGHVALYAGDGLCWSVDIRRRGYFDLVPVAEVNRQWNLSLAGYSLDINGVQVVPDPAKPTPRLDHALDDLRAARDARRKGSRMRQRIRAAIRAVRGIREDAR